MGRNKLLLISPDYESPYSAEGLVNRKLALALAKTGLEVHVLTRRGNAGYGLHSQPLPLDLGRPSSRATALGRLATLKRTVAVKARRLRSVRNLYYLRDHARDVRWVQTVTPHLQNLLRHAEYLGIISFLATGHMAVLAAQQGILPLPWIAVWNDPYPVERYPEPYGFGPTAPILPFQRMLLESVALHATGLVFPTAEMRAYMSLTLPRVAPAKSVTIPHVALDLTPPPRGNVPQNQPFTLCFTGDLHRERRPEGLLDAIVLWRRLRHTPIQLRIVGSDHVGVPQLVNKRDLADQVRVSPYVSYSECQRVLHVSHVGVVIEPILSNPIFLPSKVADYVQANLPILSIGSANTALANLLSRYGGGLAARSDDPYQIFHCLSALHTAMTGLAANPHLSRSQLMQYMSESSVSAQYQSLLRDC